MVGTQHEPSTQQESKVQDSGTDKKSDHTWKRQSECEQEHVIVVEITEESQYTTPLSKHCQTYNNTSYVYQSYGVDRLE